MYKPAAFCRKDRKSIPEAAYLTGYMTNSATFNNENLIEVWGKGDFGKEVLNMLNNYILLKDSRLLTIKETKEVYKVRFRCNHIFNDLKAVDIACHKKKRKPLTFHSSDMERFYVRGLVEGGASITTEKKTKKHSLVIIASEEILKYLDQYFQDKVGVPYRTIYQTGESWRIKYSSDIDIKVILGYIYEKTDLHCRHRFNWPIQCDGNK